MEHKERCTYKLLFDAEKPKCFSFVTSIKLPKVQSFEEYWCSVWILLIQTNISSLLYVDEAVLVSTGSQTAPILTHQVWRVETSDFSFFCRTSGGSFMLSLQLHCVRWILFSISVRRAPRVGACRKTSYVFCCSWFHQVLSHRASSNTVMDFKLRCCYRMSKSSCSEMYLTRVGQKWLSLFQTDQSRRGLSSRCSLYRWNS